MAFYRLRYFCLIVLLAILAGCSSSGKRSGGYYQNDGPGGSPPANIEAIPDAIPRIEAYAPANLRPYSVFGRRYVPISGNAPYREEGIASWYGRQFHGNKTANGETYDMYAMTAAHPTLPIPSYARVTRPTTGRSIIVRINDRGPFHPGRIIDLSYVAAAKLGLIGPGSGKVVVEAITQTDISRGTWKTPGQNTVAVASQNAQDMAAPPAQTFTADEPAMTPLMPDALSAIALTDSNGVTSPDDAGNAPTSPNSTFAAPSEQAQIAPPASSGFYLQFGAFGNAENAQALAQKLNIQIAGVESQTVHVAQGGELFRVQLGPYTDRTQAVNAAVRVYDAVGAQPTIALR
ncbi:septal ring lytic transglycosylase RlpA family protein [Pusillimonas sp. NJUB218]|uniref:septal ring lytic transglycosylase RlpA family protein n=1 Tax=Pusillimonas sp. NJUB218 TaxID=2023230 RepID=UPI000F4B38E6|nr:septal ring lytic transglycosylase RlpA family protein [Pusillimonas sp. NJUB218]ROT44891.1 hypothetical protein CHR62_10715 [Pusillimonas sp. NJUB218]